MIYDQLSNLGFRQASPERDYASRFWRSHEVTKDFGDREARLRRKMIGLIALMLAAWVLMYLADHGARSVLKLQHIGAFKPHMGAPERLGAFARTSRTAQ